MSERPRWTWSRVIGSAAFLAAIYAVIAFALGFSVLVTSHPHEDAFILFKYARMLADGQGITFWPGGPPTEGATDFLWMVFVSGLTWIGLDVALAAVIGNALGAAALALAFRQIVKRVGGPAWLALVPLTFLFGGPAFAAYIGFGTLPYCAVLCWLFVQTFGAWTERRCAPSIAWLALVLSLLRPDGVVLSAPFVLIGAVAAFKSHDPARASLREYVRQCGFVALAGASYFAWRWWYFGLPLPLPLYVKSQGNDAGALADLFTDPHRALPGLDANVTWLLSWSGPLPMLAASILILALARGAGALRLTFAAVLCLLPGVLHLAALCFALQSQNIGDRFQAPFFVLSLITVITLAASIRQRGARRWIALALAFLSAFPPPFQWVPRMSGLWAGYGYADTFAVRLGRELAPGRVLALTEAGRLAFWTDARVEDLVGLNNLRTAMEPLDVEYLAEVKPDVLMFYAGPFALREYPSPEKPILRVQRGLLTESIRPEFRAAFGTHITTYSRVMTPERASALVSAAFLESTEGYEVYAVGNVGKFSHVYGFRADLPELPRILDALRATTGPGAEYIPYWRAAHDPAR